MKIFERVQNSGVGLDESLLQRDSGQKPFSKTRLIVSEVTYGTKVLLSKCRSDVEGLEAAIGSLRKDLVPQ